MTRATLDAFRAADLDHLAKREIDPARMRPMDGSKCVARSADGVAIAHSGECIDFGEAYAVSPARNGTHGHTPMRFLPPVGALSSAKADAEAVKHATSLRDAIEALQFPPSSQCTPPEGDKPIFYMHELPQVGFGSVIEYAMLFLARGLAINAPMRIGRSSSEAWTSPWFCGAQRSLTCYFNLTGCCAMVRGPGAAGRPLELPRRRDPINVAARGYNEYGSMWVSSVLARFLFDRLTPHTRGELERRRAGTRAAEWLGARGGVRGGAGGRPLVIGMHIRRGDSCHKMRYCPSNLTSSYFAAADTLRQLYGATRILLATDDREAARLCAERVYGFECTTQAIERKKFESADLIENRVAQHTEGALSGSSVALDALADMDMLADADLFVLLLRSCFARVAYALALGRKGRPPPVISLEAPWSPYHMGKDMKQWKVHGKGQGMMARKWRRGGG